MKVIRATAIGTACLVLCLLAAACGSSGPSVAYLGDSTSTGAAGGSPQATSLKAGALQYSHCMRAHGIPDFPDPNSKGEISLSDQPGSDLNPSSPALQAAQRACAKSFFKASPTAAQVTQFTAELLRFARCVRAHGIPDFPDPSSLGPNQGVGFLIDRNTIDPHSPAVQAATTACQTTLHVNPAFRSYG